MFIPITSAFRAYAKIFQTAVTVLLVLMTVACGGATTEPQSNEITAVTEIDTTGLTNTGSVVKGAAGQVSIPPKRIIVGAIWPQLDEFQRGIFRAYVRTQPVAFAAEGSAMPQDAGGKGGVIYQSLNTTIVASDLQSSSSALVSLVASRSPLPLSNTGGLNTNTLNETQASSLDSSNTSANAAQSSAGDSSLLESAAEKALEYKVVTMQRGFDSQYVMVIDISADMVAKTEDAQAFENLHRYLQQYVTAMASFDFSMQLHVDYTSQTLVIYGTTGISNLSQLQALVLEQLHDTDGLEERVSGIPSWFIGTMSSDKKFTRFEARSKS